MTTPVGPSPVAEAGAARGLFPLIAQYAFLSDCESNCLIAPSGAVEWMCLPRPDSPSVFGAMLDRSAGAFRVGPFGVREPAARRYLPGSLIVETTWQTRTGWLIVRDVLLLGPWHNLEQRSHTHRRPPSDLDAEHCLLRTVKCVSGTVDLSVRCTPVFDYGRRQPIWNYDGPGYGEAVATCEQEDAVTLRLTTDLRLGLEGPAAQVRTRMVEGDQSFVALSWGHIPPPRTWEQAAARQWTTSEFWRQWINDGEFPDHPWRPYLQRSALTLKGLTYAPTGALLAAATTSLPETPGGERNWDYRYAWVRDSTFALWGLYTLGLDREANDFFAFILDVAGEQDLQLMYGVGGERELPEQTLDHLSGYQGARPVRIGNGAVYQRQHDVWGALLDSVYLHVKSREQPTAALWTVLLRQVEQAVTYWREPDCGMWEVRSAPKHFTSSKLRGMAGEPRQPLRCHPWASRDRAGDHRSRSDHGSGLRELRARWRKDHQGVRHRAGRRGAAGRVDRADHLGPRPDAPVREGELVAAGMARPAAAHRPCRAVGRCCRPPARAARDRAGAAAGPSGS